MDDKATCQAILRSLSALGKQLAMRLSMVAGDASDEVVTGWGAEAGEMERALEELVRLRVVHRSTQERRKRQHSQLLSAAKLQSGSTARLYYSASEGFARAFRGILQEGAGLKAVGDASVGSADLGGHAQAAWQLILHYMLGAEAGDDVALPSDEVTGFLRASGYVGDAGITGDGFRFLFAERRAQVWALVRAHVAGLDEGAARVEALRMAFQLAALTPGKEYDSGRLCQAVGADRARFGGVLRRYSDLGLVVVVGDRVMPTPLAADLTADGDAAGTSMAAFGEGWLVVESNFRVYAYTQSALQVRLLSLFVAIKYQLANMVVGQIKRRCVRAAFMKGIGAAQMLEFFRANAHRQMLARKPVVPENVSDQIRLWERERTRLRLTQGYLYNSFSGKDEFDRARKVAEECGALVAVASDESWMFVDKTAHDNLSGN